MSSKMLQPHGIDVSLERVHALPLVDCVFALTMTNSTTMDGLASELLSPYGLMDRTTILEQPVDPDGKVAGIARAHLGAWNASLKRSCNHTLVFEDDAFFDAAVAGRSLPRTEAFLLSGMPYDVLLLGWAGTPGRTQAGPSPLDCVNNISFWIDAHAYIISPEAARLWHTADWYALRKHDADTTSSTAQQLATTTHHENDGAIDLFMARQDRGRFYAVRPMVAFQRFHHNSSSLWNRVAELFWSTPDAVHELFEQQVYANLSAPSC